MTFKTCFLMTNHTPNTLTTNTNPNPAPANTKPPSNQPHTADDALVILATKTTLSETQKNVLRKGLTFIPKPKNLTIQILHKDVNNFMHRMKLKFEMKLKKNLKYVTPLQPKLKRTPNPEQWRVQRGAQGARAPPWPWLTSE